MLFKKRCLADLKEKGTFNAAIAKVLLTKYFKSTKHNSSMRTAKAHSSCCYLTENEEHSLVQLCTVLGTMGYELIHEYVHRLADQLVIKM